MYCSHCGKMLGPGDYFCSTCGHAINSPIAPMHRSTIDYSLTKTFKAERPTNKCSKCNGTGKMSITDNDLGVLAGIITIGLAVLVVDEMCGGIECDKCSGTGRK